jgi:hypothetical protein
MLIWKRRWPCTWQLASSVELCLTPLCLIKWFISWLNSKSPTSAFSTTCLLTKKNNSWKIYKTTKAWLCPWLKKWFPNRVESVHIHIQSCKNETKQVNMQHHVYKITCIPINHIYVGQSIDPFCRFWQHHANPFFCMWTDAKKFQPFENHFKLDVIFSNFHKYLIK